MIDVKQEKTDESIELIDQGQASRATKGLTFVLVAEFGAPPFNKIFPF